MSVPDGETGQRKGEAHGEESDRREMRRDTRKRRCETVYGVVGDSLNGLTEVIPEEQTDRVAACKT